ncbi:hypothetical protein I552_0116 [Mycobacterium xenopi 3993]|nr:hypothetical protein I552_0116 [Mycobacterium xenopi 3993]
MTSSSESIAAAADVVEDFASRPRGRKSRYGVHMGSEAPTNIDL